MSETPQQIAVTEAAPAVPADLALASMSPAQFVAETYAPFVQTMAAHIAEAEKVQLDITTPAGMREAVKWRALFRDEYRLPIEAKRKAAKAPLLEAGKLIDARAAELVEQVHPLEQHFHEQIKAEEKRKEDARLAAIEANRKRVAAHEQNLADIASIPASMVNATAAAILARHDALSVTVVGGDWEEFADRAVAAINKAVEQLQSMYREKLAAEEAAAAEAAAREAERQRIAAEQAELARQRAEQEAEQRRLAEQRAQLEREQAEVRRLAQEAEAARQRLADAQAAELKRQADELAADRMKFEEEQNRIAAARRAAEELERDHAEALAMNAAWTPPARLADPEPAEAACEPVVAAEEPQQLAALLDMPEAEPTDEEIIDFYVETFGGTPEQAIERLQRFAREIA